MLVGRYPYRPVTTDRFATQKDNVIRFAGVRCRICDNCDIIFRKNIASAAASRLSDLVGSRGSWGGTAKSAPPGGAVTRSIAFGWRVAAQPLSRGAESTRENHNPLYTKGPPSNGLGGKSGR